MPLTSQTSVGILWIVATPLGNLGDFSPRARQTLAEADLVLAEDTRRAGLLCSQCGIAVKRFSSFHDHNEAEKQAEVLRFLQEGGRVALVSDAGTPLVADPGYRLVRACREQGIRVVPIPGPSAPVTALSAAGLPPLPYSFLGFLPRDHSGRKQLFTTFSQVPGSLIFFERKDRLIETLEQAKAVLGNRRFAVCRELTKTHEEFILGQLNEVPARIQDILGEVTVIIGPSEEQQRTPESDVRIVLRSAQEEGGKAKDIARRVATQVDGWTVKELYALLNSGA